MKLGIQDSKSTEEEKQKQVENKNFGPKNTVQENISLLI